MAPASWMAAVSLGVALAGPAQADDMAGFQEAWATSRGAGVTVAVVGTDPSAVVDLVEAGAPDAVAVAVPVPGDGNGNGAPLVAAVDSAVGDGAGVVVLEHGEGSLAALLSASPALVDAVSNAARDGVVVLAGAGSSGDRDAPPPPDTAVLVVGAVNAAGQPLPYTNIADRRIVAALGTEPAPTTTAAARVAALAALLLAQGRAPEDVPEVIAASAVNPVGDARLGRGYIDAAAAVAIALDPADAPTATTSPVSNEPAPVATPSASAAPPIREHGVSPDPADGLLVVAAVALAVIAADCALGLLVWRRRSNE